jgi:hypothetical protein
MNSENTNTDQGQQPTQQAADPVSTDTTNVSDSLLDMEGTENSFEVKDGQKPKDLDDKYWDPEGKKVRVDELYKSLQDAEKRAKGLRDKLARGDGKAPKDIKEYSFTPPEKYAQLVPENDPVVGAAKEIAHKYGMPKEMFSSFMADMTEKLGGLAENLQDQPVEMSE